MKSKNKTALVLCGGGAQGAAEIGFYQAMVELGIEPDYVVGTSVGALNGAFIASGIKIPRLKKYGETFPLASSTVLTRNFSGNGARFPACSNPPA